MKRLIGLALIVAMVIAGITPVLAAEPVIASAEIVGKKQVRPGIWCGNKTIQATPGNPVTLEGSGVACARGHGKLNYKVEGGRVVVGGSGVVAVKGAESVKAYGWGGKFEAAGWTFYWGKGRVVASGHDFRLLGWVNHGVTRATGKGKVTYRGTWKIRYGRLLEIEAHEIEPIKLPVEIQDKVDTSILDVAE